MDNEIITERICVYGIVQGVGFRPFVSRAADSAGVRGSVCNRGSYVEIFAQGSREQLDRLLYSLENEAPERSAILKIDRKPLEGSEIYDSFEIVDSAKEKGAIFVSPDIAICPKCKEELFDPKDRRYMHPFINCTACGPRLTILDSMPYDRVRTSMGEFPMCPKCHYEYTHPETRRYDAQPVCCNDCGPEVYVAGTELKGSDAITAARRKISEGGIIAVKGIGGFHLCCDATNEEAVVRLRKLKPRPAKPFAVMAGDLAAADRECLVTDAQREILDGHQKPIVLMEKREGGKLAPSIAPDNPKVGIMLPYAPVQLLLFTYTDDVSMPDLLVMTSANVSGAPIVRDDETAVKEISHMVDLILSNNRKIRMRADDTVMDFYRGNPYIIRRSRGYAPLPFMLDGMKGNALGIGGELKNTFCLSSDELFYPSPYVGDMADVRTVRALEETVERMSQLLEIKPQVIACDLHPRYNTGVVAEKLAAELDIPLERVQHHYAHVVSCMAENECFEPVIGVSFDGTGYGTDGSIWGGEILKADLTDFERLGSITPFPQSGGDLSAKEGWRIAAGMFHRLWPEGGEAAEKAEKLGLCTPDELKLIARMADLGVNTVRSTSAGRLFDGVSAILGIRRASSFEGEASMSLQFAAEAFVKSSSIDPGCYVTEAMDIDINNDGPDLIPTDRIVRELTEAAVAGEDPGKLAWRFHCMLASGILGACRKACGDTGIGTVALTGGVFQNRLLLELCQSALEREDLRVLRHSMIPSNDGGISLGQAVVAVSRMNKR